MKRSFTSRHLLAALAWLGLVLAPFTMPSALAASTELAVAKIEMASTDKPEGMPCCPDEPAKSDCKDCPFMAICAGMPFPTVTGGSSLVAPIALLGIIAPRSDDKLSGWAQGPPARPPKPGW